MEPFESECRAHFAECCEQYHAAAFHKEMREAVADAYGYIDAFLDWCDVQNNL